MTVAADVAVASCASGDELARRTASRLAELLEAAIHRSPLYRRWLQGRTLAPRLADMPVMGKADLMRSFDTWCCDPGLRIKPLRRFVADPGNVGRPFLDRYTVWESSGSSGEPAL